MSVSPPKSYIQRRRLEFIEWKLYWERRLNRSDIEEQFEVSTPQASTDIKLYRELAGENFEYDSGRKAYLPTKSFKPKFLTISADRLLLQLRAYLINALGRKDVWFREIPPVDMAPDIIRDIDPRRLKSVLSAIRRKRQIEIEYQSLTKCKWRTIAPHALAFDGYRWHLRAWSPDRNDFRDFVLSRIRGMRKSGPASFSPEHDMEWHRKVVLKLCPHPDLDAQQTEAIQCDYNMKNGMREVSVRLSMAYYFIKRMNLDLDDIPAKRAQIRLANIDEVNEAIAVAKRETGDLVGEALAEQHAHAEQQNQ